MSETLPPPDTARVAATAPRGRETLELPAGTTVLRLHALAGRHPSSWNQLRNFGPTTARFDHHPPPPRLHPDYSIMYCTTGPEAFTTALAEYFQDSAGRVGPIDRVAGAPTATAFTLAAPLRLLDLRSGWATRAGGNQALVAGIRSSARAWARAVHSAHSHIQGLVYPSSVWGPGVCLAIWERGGHAVPTTNDLHRLLSDPVLDQPLADAAERLGTLLIG